MLEGERMAEARARTRRWALSVAIQDNQARLDQARVQMGKLERKERRKRNSIQYVCFVLYVWSAPSAAIALAYAEHVLKTTGFAVDVSSSSLEKRYIETSMETLMAIAARTGGAPPRCLIGRNVAPKCQTR